MSSPKSVAIITFSTRTPRIGPEVSSIVKEVISGPAASSNLNLSPVDLKDFNLPVFDEAVVPAAIPAMGTFQHAHSIAWSKEIARHDAYVLVIPEYNYGMSGGTKNAVDYLKNEWNGKPVVIVSYGIKGGTTASEQLAHTLSNMGLRVAATRPALAFAGGPGDEMNGAVFKGVVGPESRKEWVEKKGEDILKAFGELKDLLEKEPEQANGEKAEEKKD